MDDPFERFLAQVWTDADGGHVHPLEHYLERFPGCDARIREEYDEVVRHAVREPAPGDGRDAQRGVRCGATEAILERLAKAPRFDEERFQSEGEIGHGGMGTVSRVRDTVLGRRLALKVMRTSPLGLAPSVAPMARGNLARFLEEAQVTSQLDHPGIVPVHELGLDAEGRLWFTMRLIEGRTAQEVFRDARAERQGWTRPRALEVVLKVCDAIAFAHDRGVLHRDLKPSNVMVGSFGEVYVVDWGLVKVMDHLDRHDLRIRPERATDESGVLSARSSDAGIAEDSSVVTVSGQVLGTPCYMSPEQACGEVLDARADIYAIGAMLYELCTGVPPYSESAKKRHAYRVLDAVRAGPPQPIHALDGGVPAELIAIVERAMARDRAHRYGRAMDVANDLRAFLDKRVVSAYRTGAIVELQLWIRRNAGLASALAGAVLILIAGIVSAGILLEQVNANALAEKAARTSAQAHLERFELLRDVVTLRDAKKAELELYPAFPEKVPAMEAWLRDFGEPLAKRLPMLRQSVQSMLAEDATKKWSADVIKNADNSHVTRLGDNESESDLRGNQFVVETLSALVRDLDEFVSERGLLAAVRARLDGARNIAKRSIGAHMSKWSCAIDAIQGSNGVTASKLYHNLVLRPQIGLVPLGMDQVSKLWEFYDIDSGAPPALDMAAGSYAVEGGSAIVFVLLPGGKVVIGASREGGVADAYARDNEGPLSEFDVEPVFMSKYELTKGCWRRLSGEDDIGHYRLGVAYDGNPGIVDLKHPVECISWNRCLAVLVRHGMTLPNEVQWEYACRAGTRTPWWSGPHASDLVDCENLLDITGERHEPLWGAQVGDFDDHFTSIAPVGQFKPNPFGLYDMHGNVSEWCINEYRYVISAKAAVEMRPDCGADTQIVARGGNYASPAPHARAAWRAAHMPNSGRGNLGVRPVRRVMK